MREQILTEIRRLAAEVGAPPGREAFERAAWIRPASWLGVYWARWGDALKEAGYEPNAFQGRVEEQHLLRSFAEAVRRFRKIPTHAQVRMFGKSKPDFPSHSTFTSNFPNKVAMLSKLREWIEATGECADIAHLIPKQAASIERTPPLKEGLVYLIKSGRTLQDRAQRRVGASRQRRIALPEAAALNSHRRSGGDRGLLASSLRGQASERRVVQADECRCRGIQEAEVSVVHGASWQPTFFWVAVWGCRKSQAISMR
jgi:hypothetical protein